MKTPPKSRRIQAIQVELDRAADEYASAKLEFDTARVHFETARERFATVKRLGREMLGPEEWRQWQFAHPSVMYAVMSIGDAIQEVLQQRAFLSAFDTLEDSDRVFNPNMMIEEIHRTLEEGGFEFKSATPLREINAALIRLHGVEKVDPGRYAVKDAQEILAMVRDSEPVEEEPEPVEEEP